MAPWLDHIFQFLTVLLSASVLQSFKIDPETVPRTIIRRHDNAELQLVMSDEFSLEGRSFAKGDDDVFEAQQRPDDINQAISFCEFCSIMKAVQIAFSVIHFFLSMN
jgi:Beta-glucan synthesis-associated protein SKN1/KRE6/Sbg1